MSEKEPAHAELGPRSPGPAPPLGVGGSEAAAVARIDLTVLLDHVEKMHEIGRRPEFRPWRWSWWHTWSWLLITAMAVAAYVLAVVYGPASLGRNLVDGLKLFPSAFPGYVPGPWEYALGKHIAALVSLIVTLRVLVALFSDRMAQIRARLSRGHAVVCGLGETGLRSVSAFRAAGCRVTAVDSDPSAAAVMQARELGAVVFRGDATEVSTLRAARVHKADNVVCSGPDDPINTRMAALIAAVASARVGDRSLNVYVRIDDPDLAQLLRAPLANVGDAQFNFFNISTVWARAMLDAREGPFARLGATPPQIVILGCTSTGKAVAVGAARRWHAHVRKTHTDLRATIVLVGPTAEEDCRALLARYPAVPRVCDLVPAPQVLKAGAQPIDAVPLLGDDPTADATYLCMDDQSANLALALDIEHRLRGETRIFLPAAGAAEALGPLLLSDGKIRPVVLSLDAASIEVLHDQMRERLAEEAHEAYLAERRGVAGFGSRPADRPWHDLGTESRRASRAHIAHMLEQLRAVWYVIEPLYDWDEPVTQLTAEAIAAMAELEHARWCRDRVAAGWRPAVVRDDERHEHDLLVPWTQLPEEARDIDRRMVRARPSILAGAGFRLARDPAREELARRLHERYLATKLRRGETAEHLGGWSELTEEVREQNRLVVDHIAVKLARVGCRSVPRTLGRFNMAEFTDAEAERMAELEHERWVAERLARGWKRGTRDDGARFHPDLVDWRDLTEEAREKDRDVVRAIPGLLASAGYMVIRDS